MHRTHAMGTCQAKEACENSGRRSRLCCTRTSDGESVRHAKSDPASVPDSTKTNSGGSRQSDKELPGNSSRENDDRNGHRLFCNSCIFSCSSTGSKSNSSHSRRSRRKRKRKQKRRVQKRPKSATNTISGRLSYGSSRSGLSIGTGKSEAWSTENHNGFCDCLEYRDENGKFYEVCRYETLVDEEVVKCLKQDSICECKRCRPFSGVFDEDVISEAFSEGSVISSVAEEDLIEGEEGEISMWILNSAKTPEKVFIPQPQGCLRTTPRQPTVKKKQVKFDKVWVRSREQEGVNIMFPGAFYFNISDYYYQL